MKLFVVLSAYGTAEVFKNEKDAVEEFNSHVVEENKIDGIDGLAAGDGDYDEPGVVLASNVEINLEQVDVKQEKCFKNMILQWVESYNYSTHIVEKDYGVTIVEEDLDDCETEPTVHMGKNWKDLFENIYLDEIIRNYNDDGQDVIDRFGKKNMKFCLSYKK